MDFFRLASDAQAFYLEQQHDILKLNRTGWIKKKPEGGYVGELDMFMHKEASKRFGGLLDCLVISEEVEDGGAPIFWSPRQDKFVVLDPWDGTHNTRMGLLSGGSMMALVELGNIVFSCIYLPFAQQVSGNGFFFAVKGVGIFQALGTSITQLNPLRVSNQVNLSDAYISLEGPCRGLPGSEFARRIQKIAGWRNGPSCAYSFTCLASGLDHEPISIDGVVSFGCKLWDILPGILFTEEAGGKVTDFYGRPWSLENCSNLVFSNGLLHDEILRLNCPALEKTRYAETH